MKSVTAVHISPESFAQFGKAIRISEGLQPDAESDIQKYYGKLAVMKCSGAVQVGICAAKKRPFIVTELEQHVKTAELLIALKGDFVVPAARSIAKDGREIPDVQNLRAFYVNQGEGLVFEEGVWHWTPYALGDSCEVLVVFKTDTPQNDFIPCKLDEAVEIK